MESDWVSQHLPQLLKLEYPDCPRFRAFTLADEDALEEFENSMIKSNNMDLSSIEKCLLRQESRPWTPLIKHGFSQALDIVWAHAKIYEAHKGSSYNILKNFAARETLSTYLKMTNLGQRRKRLAVFKYYLKQGYTGNLLWAAHLGLPGYFEGLASLQPQISADEYVALLEVTLHSMTYS